MVPGDSSFENLATFKLQEPESIPGSLIIVNPAVSSINQLVTMLDVPS